MEKKEMPIFLSDILYNYSSSKIFIPELKSFMLSDFVRAFGFKKMKSRGMRAGEKKHEVLFDGSARKKDGYYIIGDDHNDVIMRYSSDIKHNLLSIEEIKERLDKIFKGGENENVES
ncbi:hypothetical protein LCGC14_2294500 [marine sediment metagenome]|uniref:Uncharacterized protein n=1 Tax=marine sediment metagenome TaxID=412755 RepID=A0A0F9FKD9_9ZZZZ